jgi:hypothetical protein
MLPTGGLGFVTFECRLVHSRPRNFLWCKGLYRAERVSWGCIDRLSLQWHSDCMQQYAVEVSLRVHKGRGPKVGGDIWTQRNSQVLNS